MKSFSLDLDTLLTVAAAVLDREGVLQAANAGFLRLLPARCTQPIGTKVARYFIQPTFAALMKEANESAQDGYRGLLAIGDYDGSPRTLRGRVWKADGDIRLLAEYDIADLEALADAMLSLNRESVVAEHSLAQANRVLKQREAQNIETSLTDVLTGVGNRRKLDQTLAIEISRSRRSGSRLSAMMSDIDHFKLVNDEYGHALGDNVVARYAALLVSQTRLTDTVARFGGDEFVVVMPDTNLSEALSKAEQVRHKLETEPIEPLTKAVTASFGVTELLPGDDAASLLARIDAALYLAKQRGRNNVAAAASEPATSDRS